MAVVIGATVMVALDTTIVSVALFQIGEDLEVARGIEWVTTAYLLAVCVSQPASGWLSDRLGQRQFFLCSLAVFTVASAACSVASNLPVLMIARFAQGLGGGPLIPVGMAIALSMFDRSFHGRAMSVWGIAAMIAPAAGPTLGGWIVSSVSWRWLFLINVPLGVCTLVAGHEWLPPSRSGRHQPFDSLGLLFGCGGLSLAVVGLSEANSRGWTSPTILLAMTLGVTGLVSFCLHELRSDHPLLQLRIFADASFRRSIGAVGLVHFAYFAQLVFLPLQLGRLRGETALAIGLVYLPAGVSGALAMRLGGHMADRSGPRLPIVLGCMATTLSMIGLASLSMQTSLAVISVILCVQGVGLGMVTAPGLVAGLSNLPQQLVGQGAAVRSLVGQVAGASSIALLGALIAVRSGADPAPARSQAAYDAAFALAAAGTAFATWIAWRLPRHRTIREHMDRTIADDIVARVAGDALSPALGPPPLNRNSSYAGRSSVRRDSPEEQPP